MTRGRKRDLTIQASRSLVLQRAYRDRKAKHVADLEERCQKAEAENERLKQELVLLRASRGHQGSVVNSYQVVSTAIFLLHARSFNGVWSLYL
jgi:hypothetical protein